MADGTTGQSITVGESDFLMLLHTINEHRKSATIAAEIVHDLVPLEDEEGDLNLTGRHLRFLAQHIENDMEAIYEQLVKSGRPLGFNPANYG